MWSLGTAFCDFISASVFFLVLSFDWVDISNTQGSVSRSLFQIHSPNNSFSCSSSNELCIIILTCSLMFGNVMKCCVSCFTYFSSSARVLFHFWGRWCDLSRTLSCFDFTMWRNTVPAKHLTTMQHLTRYLCSSSSCFSLRCGFTPFVVRIGFA